MEESERGIQKPLAETHGRDEDSVSRGNLQRPRFPILLSLLENREHLFDLLLFARRVHPSGLMTHMRHGIAPLAHGGPGPDDLRLARIPPGEAVVHPLARTGRGGPEHVLRALADLSVQPVGHPGAVAEDDPVHHPLAEDQQGAGDILLPEKPFHDAELAAELLMIQSQAALGVFIGAGDLALHREHVQCLLDAVEEAAHHGERTGDDLLAYPRKRGSRPSRLQASFDDQAAGHERMDLLERIRQVHDVAGGACVGHQFFPPVAHQLRQQSSVSPGSKQRNGPGPPLDPDEVGQVQEGLAARVIGFGFESAVVHGFQLDVVAKDLEAGEGGQVDEGKMAERMGDVEDQPLVFGDPVHDLPEDPPDLIAVDSSRNLDGVHLEAGLAKLPFQGNAVFLEGGLRAEEQGGVPRGVEGEARDRGRGVGSLHPSLFGRSGEPPSRWGVGAGTDGGHVRALQLAPPFLA